MEKKIVYFVDDDEMLLHNLGSNIKSMGFDVRTFNSPTDFLNQISHEDSGCILLDVHMPEIDGLKLQQKLDTLGVHMPIIILTGYGDVPICTEAMKKGALDFLEKPVVEEKLLIALENAFAFENERILQRDEKTEAIDRYKKLTKREKEVFELIIQAYTSIEIADQLGISINTVKLHRKNLMRKLAVQSLPAIINFAHNLT